MSRPARPTARILVVGDEILSGKIHESNSYEAARVLRASGVALTAIHVVPDDPAAIAEWVAGHKGRHAHLLVIGGIGPTHDDRTYEGIALGLSRPLVTRDELVADLKVIYGPTLNPAHLKMARVPQGAELVHGEGLRYPVVKLDEILVFPGHPTFFSRNLAVVRPLFGCAPLALARVKLRSTEPEIAEIAADLERRFGVTVGSYPDYGNPAYSVLITIEADDASTVAAASGHLLTALPRDAVVEADLPPVPAVQESPTATVGGPA